MKRKILVILGALMVGIFSLQAAPTYAAGCTDTFLGMRPWYYDDGNGVTICAGGDIQAPADGDAIPAYVWKIAMNILFDLFLAIGYIAMGFVIYGGYQVLELDRNIEKHLAKKQYEEVGHELYLLEKSVDMKEKCNQQLVLGLKNGEAFRDGKITCKEALKKANELLEMTYHLENTEKDRMQYRRIPFRNEMYLFNQICIFLRRDGRIGEAIELLERMMRTYDGAVEKRKYHFKDVSLCQTNLSKWMEMENRLEEAENIANKAIREKLVCGNINFIHRLLATKFDIVEKQNNNVLYHKGWLRWAYFLSEWCRL